MNDHIIQKKLSGVYSSHTFDIPFKLFESYIVIVKEELSERGVAMPVATIMDNIEIQSAFVESVVHGIAQTLSEFDEYENIWETVSLVFSNEIQLVEDKKEQQRLARQQIADDKHRLRVEANKASKNVASEFESVIIVDCKNEKKAIAILKAAGIL